MYEAICHVGFLGNAISPEHHDDDIPPGCHVVRLSLEYLDDGIS